MTNAQFNHEKQFPYPADHTVGFFSEFENVERFVQDLVMHGFQSTDIDIIYGYEGLKMIDLEGTQHSFLDRLVRLSQKFWGSGEWIFFEQADTELRQGHYLLTVLTQDEQLKDQVIDLMEKHDAHEIKYFNTMYVEDITHGSVQSIERIANESVRFE